MLLYIIWTAEVFVLFVKSLDFFGYGVSLLPIFQNDPLLNLVLLGSNMPDLMS